MLHPYVTSQTCCMRRVFDATDEYQGKPVVEHGDLTKWTWSESETIAMARGDVKRFGAGTDLYMIQTAKLVCDHMSWDYQFDESTEAAQ